MPCCRSPPPIVATQGGARSVSFQPLPGGCRAAVDGQNRPALPDQALPRALQLQFRAAGYAADVGASRSTGGRQCVAGAGDPRALPAAGLHLPPRSRSGRINRLEAGGVSSPSRTRTVSREKERSCARTWLPGRRPPSAAIAHSIPRRQGCRWWSGSIEHGCPGIPRRRRHSNVSAPSKLHRLSPPYPPGWPSRHGGPSRHVSGTRAPGGCPRRTRSGCASRGRRLPVRWSRTARGEGACGAAPPASSSRRGPARATAGHTPRSRISFNAPAERPQRRFLWLTVPRIVA